MATHVERQSESWGWEGEVRKWGEENAREREREGVKR